jgi:hypothetical protein
MANPTVSLIIVPLIPNALLPQPASARTRSSIPPGYGVQEQCLPFAAASALGFLIPSPIRFGLCPPGEVPQGCHSFRSPLDRSTDGVHFTDPRVFYVADNVDCRFRYNAYDFEGIPVGRSRPSTVREPGVSFFDRPDQQDLFKLHLPYIWRTPEAVDTLFLPLLNRSAQGLEVQSGLVETDWYTSPVNLILRKPPGSTHLRAGDPVAHAILIARSLRRPSMEVAQGHSRLSREARVGLADWEKRHAEDRSAYKVLARSRHGCFEAESSTEPDRKSHPAEDRPE